ncbi:hypothetical protein FG386_001895 [Cryptosporidium ryanae]|uniref:uncharacterized protein n=1 Tax=Cryptosporidium ryanae TaxID=515981 RepID=UPI00351A7106|nr:hypothetical protein FG386_001895 [Cryptosporidium ryanae]
MNTGIRLIFIWLPLGIIVINYLMLLLNVDCTNTYNNINLELNKENEYDWDGRVVVIGDIHGDLKSLVTCLYLSGITDKNFNWAANNTMLIQIGDIVDRGPYAFQIYKLFNKLRNQAPLYNSKFIGLIGNHEIMNLCGQLQYVTNEDIETYGGSENRMFEWSDNGFIGKYVKTLKLVVRVNDSLFVHAGLHPKYAKVGINMLEQNSKYLLNDIYKHCDDYNSLFFSEDGPLWTREISLGSDDISCSLVKDTLNILNLNRMIIGHTIQLDNRINLKCNNSLYLVDTGFSEAIYGKPCLLELLYKQKNSGEERYNSPYSINELVIKENNDKLKYIHVNNIFLNKNATLTLTNKNKDEL